MAQAQTGMACCNRSCVSQQLHKQDAVHTPPSYGRPQAATTSANGITTKQLQLGTRQPLYMGWIRRKSKAAQGATLRMRAPPRHCSASPAWHSTFVKPQAGIAPVTWHAPVANTHTTAPGRPHMPAQARQGSHRVLYQGRGSIPCQGRVGNRCPHEAGSYYSRHQSALQRARRSTPPRLPQGMP